MKTKTVLLTVGIAMSLFVSVVLVNDIKGTYTTVGEPYAESFSYCGQWAGAGGTRHCSLWLVGKETRINTKVNGYFWDHDSYKVVR